MCLLLVECWRVDVAAETVVKVAVDEVLKVNHEGEKRYG